MEDCRFCGTSEGVKISIFDPTCDYVLKIEMILPLQMKSREPLPKVMCHRCFNVINEFYEFRKKCLTQDLKWRASLITVEKNNTRDSALPVTIKMEPPDSEPAVEPSTENTYLTEKASWSYTPENASPNNQIAVAAVMSDELNLRSSTTTVVTIEEDKRYEDPGKAAPLGNKVNNKTAATVSSNKGKKKSRKRIVVKAKDRKQTRNYTKNISMPDRKESAAPRAAGTSTALLENVSFPASQVEAPLRLSPNQAVQKLTLRKTALPEMPILIPEIQMPKINSTENTSVSPQTSKQPPKLTINQLKPSPEKQTTTVAYKIGPRSHKIGPKSHKIGPKSHQIALRNNQVVPRNNQNVTFEQPKPPTESEKQLPPHIIMTSIPNVCTIFTCSLCERTFTSKNLACSHNDCVERKNIAALTEADGSETDEAIYSCSHCEMKFTRYASLVPHEETHFSKKADDSDTSSSTSDKERAKKRKKKFSRPSSVELDSVKNIANVA